MRPGKKREEINGVRPASEGNEKVIASFTAKELYGYGAPDKRFSKVSRDRVTTHFPLPISMLLQVREPGEIEKTCVLLLRRLKSTGVLKSDVEIGLDTIFSNNNIPTDLRPKAVKCAVLRLLGMSNSEAKSFSDYGANNLLPFSSQFQKHIENVQRDRRMYPLKYPNEFPELITSLNRIQSSGINVEKLFRPSSVLPPLHAAVDNRGHADLSLGEVLYVVSKAVEGETVDEILGNTNTEYPTLNLKKIKVEELLSPSGTPFLSEILVLIKSKRTERTGGKTAPEKK